MKILITGAHGQLSTALQSLLSADSYVALSHADLDITDEIKVKDTIATLKPDLVINGAAYNRVDDAESETEEAFRINEKGPFYLAQGTAKYEIPFVHVSTDYVFDGQKDEAYDEEDATNPLSKYGQSKLAGEKATLENNPKSYVVRTAWVYHESGSNFLKKMLELSSKQEIKVNADQIGSPTYSTHLAQAILKLIKTDAYGIYHFAGAGQTSRFEMTQYFFELLSLKTVVHPAKSSDFPSAATRPLFSALKTTRTPQILLPSWQQGVKEFAKQIQK